METRQIHVRDLSTVTGIQQIEHEVQSIYFLGLEDFEGDLYISIESDDYSNEAIPLTNNTFIIGQPMTLYNTTYTCQIYGVLNDGEKIQLSKRFRLIVDKSNDIQGDSEEYPIDPNFTNGIIEFMNEQKEQVQSEIEATGDAVIASIPSDYTALSDIQISEADADSKVIIPCDDTYTMDVGGFTFKMGKMQFYMDGKPPYANTRINIYINGASASSNPTYASKPAWYHDPIDKFVIGHRYKFRHYLVQGSQDRGELADTINHSFVLRDKSDNAVTIGGTDETVKTGVWICTFVPEMVCINVKQFTFDNAILYFEIIDLTLQEQRKAEGYQLPIFELKNKTYTIGHSSGGNSSASDPNIPENSIEGLVQFARQGYWGVSCDIQLTSDGEWILMHDIEDGVARTTTGTGMVKDLTLAQIKELYMKKGDVVTNYRVPTVKEWLTVGRMYGVYLSLQIEEVDNVTESAIHDLVDMVKDLGMISQVMLCSFAVTHLQMVKAYDSRIFTSLLYRNWIGLNTNQLPAYIASLAKYGNVGVSVNQDATNFTAENIREYQRLGVKVGAWTAYPSTRARTIELLPYGFDFWSAEVCPNVLDLIYTEVTE